MAKENAVLEKSFAFAVRVINIHKKLAANREYILSKQLLRAGTSIGANVNEAQAGQSRNDFTAKMAIASKEARETKYWIDLLVETGYLVRQDDETKSLIDESEQLVRLLTKIVKSSACYKIDR
ncbi:four helix bundle protein [Thiohalophilus thiocyanatoxydans]|uniref:Four helix bundle protein n=1 Tax=Thiohalophilus thiocyanatoxydans TaxID=381308 RepID=A0A4R8IP36_9GAMM|nr:four helix bundle protein [Thiohalophilus thiocyanatoxydans]TDY02671.1 four helix bundle protein [Thiohalophilus thiocyanatoxydans]